MANVSNNYSKMLRGNITNKINKLPLKYFDNHETGDILSRITNDVDTMAQNMNQSLATLVTSVTLFIGSIIMMFITGFMLKVLDGLAGLRIIKVPVPQVTVNVLKLFR
jgi:ATP-binding cassette subfamily B protein